MNRRTFSIRQVLTVLLALVGIGTMVYYTLCDTACAYLKGDILGVDLQYLGVIYMALIALLAVLRKYPLMRTLLAAGVGGEVFLFLFQMKEGIYCPYCLAFMGCVVGAFALHYEYPAVAGWKKMIYLFGEVHFTPKAHRYPLVLFMLAGYGFLALTFSGSTLPVYAAEPLPRAFGKGESEIRIYTDYFCSPCRDIEPRIEKLIEEIAGKGKARILFIDTPIHSQTVLYAKYYLYALDAAGEDIRTANHIRRTLFEAAIQGISTERELEGFLRAKQIAFRPHNVLSVLNKYTEYIRADGIRSTPTVVVVTPAGKTNYGGAADIVKALEKVKSDPGTVGR